MKSQRAGASHDPSAHAASAGLDIGRKKAHKRASKAAGSHIKPLLNNVLWPFVTVAAYSTYVHTLVPRE